MPHAASWKHVRAQSTFPQQNTAASIADWGFINYPNEIRLSLAWQNESFPFFAEHLFQTKRKTWQVRLPSTFQNRSSFSSKRRFSLFRGCKVQEKLTYDLNSMQKQVSVTHLTRSHLYRGFVHIYTPETNMFHGARFNKAACQQPGH